MPEDADDKLSAVLGSYSGSRIEKLIDEWIVGYTNAYRDRFILKRRLIDGIPYYLLVDIVEHEFGQPITDRQLKRITSKGKQILNKHID